MRCCAQTKGEDTMPSLGGGYWGVPNTAIPQEKLTSTEIPCRKSTNPDTAFRSLYLKLPLSCMFIYLKHVCIILSIFKFSLLTDVYSL